MTEELEMKTTEAQFFWGNKFLTKRCNIYACRKYCGTKGRRNPKCIRDVCYCYRMDLDLSEFDSSESLAEPPVKLPSKY